MPPPSNNFRISLSVSPFAELRFASGMVFTDGKVIAKTPEELQRLFASHGANEVHARIATARPALDAIAAGTHANKH